ncbi:cellulose biosynthesis protein BcsQ [Gallaecimonas xiamenensis]|uniref:Cellulose synthase operon protein YhjQ n=1 Tax=Gallaecimonas xiamenensis 3-C-1 TaxID=745411 RepID=K2JR55_9GAMM|nr:cellulose biosynthesis protein BcsQ [Gallaecimonas xiamenensis]EKE77007.1 cellulose synthase operon protein YhjQ [Gallaecimonas xiamenensis 3-C-1]
MNLVYFHSPKGGVGKTTLVANLAFALQRLGHQVVVLDLDSQNALRLHLGLPMAERRGLVPQLQLGEDWRNLIIETPTGVGLLPYGQASREQRDAFEAALRTQPECLELGLGSLLSQPGCILLADLPSGPSLALDALARLPAMGIATLLADGASAATLPLIGQDGYLGEAGARRALYIINQVHIRSRLNRDVTEFFQHKLGASLLGMVHRDEAVPEATASQKSLFDYAPASAITQDLEDIARNISRLLPDAYAHSAMKFSLSDM